MTLIALNTQNTATPVDKDSKSEVLSLPNTDALPTELSAQRIELNFPAFTDGRAFTQAVLLRRAGYAGDIRATGDVRLDQLLQMQRCGFTSAELLDSENAAHAQALLQQFSAFYQGDTQHAMPLFARAA